MKVFLREIKSQLFFAGFRQRTFESRFAQEFSGIDRAVQFNRDAELMDMEVVLSFDKRTPEIALPLNALPPKR